MFDMLYINTSLIRSGNREWQSHYIILYSALIKETVIPIYNKFFSIQSPLRVLLNVNMPYIVSSDLSYIPPL